jgi:hypothetical protein
LLASSTKEGTAEYDEETIAAATSAAAAAIDNSSLRLPSYLLRMAGQNDISSNLNNVFEEAAEFGDGGNSDIEGDDAREMMLPCLYLFSKGCLCLKKPTQLKMQMTTV